MKIAKFIVLKKFPLYSIMYERIFTNWYALKLLGFDLLIDKDYNLHLLEVNSNPSQSVVFEKVISPGVEQIVNSQVDLDIKQVVMTDCLKIMQRKILK